jgi:uncharacterized protein YndB with AHSA1/START domain
MFGSSTARLHVCPTDVVRAPAERVWDLVTTPKQLERWVDAKVIDAPDRELRAGDRLVLGAGVGHRFKVRFLVQDAVRPHRVALHIRLPLGVTNDELIEITPIDADTSRVTFN